MQGIFIDFTKYFFLLFAFYFLFSSIKLYIAYNNDDYDAIRFFNNAQRTVIFLSHLLGFVIIALTSDDFKKIFILYSFQMVFLIIVWILISLFYRYSNMLIWNIPLYLLQLSFVMLTRLDYGYGLKQFRMAALGFLIALIVPKLFQKIRIVSKLWWLYGAFSIVLLFLANDTINGAKNWMTIGNFSFQPSEFVKIFYILLMACLLRGDFSIKKLVSLGTYTAVLVSLLIFQRDLGGALIFSTMFISLVFIKTRNSIIPAAGSVALIAGGYIGNKVFSHVQRRITAWINPWPEIDGAGFQIAQSLFAIGAGGWLGVGLTKGQPSKIPVVTTDFIFSAISEEFGNIYSIIIILFLIVFLWSAFKASHNSTNEFLLYLSAGIAILFSFQQFLIIGGVTKLIPSTGVTFPFVSYGGTSLIASCIMLGLLQGIFLIQETETENFEDTMELANIKEISSENNTRKKQRKTKNKSELKENNKAPKINQLEEPDTAIKGVKYIYSIFFVILIINLIYYVSFKSTEAVVNAYNPRMSLLEQGITRGKILDKNKVVLAETQIDERGIETRIYPFDRVFSHIIGYSHQGKTGLEALADINLLQSDLNLYDQIYFEITEKKKTGNNVITTLDSGLQKKAWDLLGSYRGAIVAIEPSTGKILCMVSKPDFNPNKLVENWDSLINNSKDSPLLNRATQGLYPPGSTFKIITAAQYLTENKAGDFSYNCTGKDEYADKTIHCYNNKAHGQVDLREAFSESCNSAFAEIGRRIDIKGLNQKTNKLLFNQSLPYQLPYSKSSFVLNSDSSYSEIAETVIGQGKTMISPLHNALITSAIANGGILMKPYLIDYTENYNGKIKNKNMPDIYSTMFTTELSRSLSQLMLGVMETGTGNKGKNYSFKSAGKTGSAENPFGNPHGWFVGYAPYDNPQIVISIVLENSDGSTKAVNIANKLFEYYIDNISK